MIYQNLRELGNNTLKFGDIVYFHTGVVQKYSVQTDHLSNCTDQCNSEIFSLLNLNKSLFCDTYYGYPNNRGDWPTCNPGDYTALTRVVRALYQEIEKKEIRDIPKYYSGQTILEGLKAKLSIEPLILEKKENTSSNIVTKRKSKVKRIIGEEPIKLNNY